MRSVYHISRSLQCFRPIFENVCDVYNRWCSFAVSQRNAENWVFTYVFLLKSMHREVFLCGPSGLQSLKLTWNPKLTTNNLPLVDYLKCCSELPWKITTLMRLHLLNWNRLWWQHQFKGNLRFTKRQHRIG